MATEFQRYCFPMKQNIINSHNIVSKPQLKFKEKIVNDSTPFLHKLKDKPHCLNPLSLRQRNSHPYEFELKNFLPDKKLLTVKHEVPLFQPVSSTPLVMVDTKADFEHLLQDLLSQTVIGVDLEHHGDRSYQGITCVMQISTDKTDYIIDTLKLRDDLQPLNKVFCDPNIVKIFQGADNDILWLQRDFGIYVVNLFDTCQAASLLGFKKSGLSFILQHYCQVYINKKYQLADWRIRPLPRDMVKYAREDTHYLIYIYERMKKDLSLRHLMRPFELNEETPKESKDRKSESKSSQIAPVKGNGANLVLEVWKKSLSVCLKRYKIPSREEMYSKFTKKGQKFTKKFNNQQLYALRELFFWRDRVARQEDESPHFVLPKNTMIQIVHQLPSKPEGILHCCSRSRFVLQHLPHLHGIVLKARTMTLASCSTRKEKDERKKPVVRSTSSVAAAASSVSKHPAKKRKIDDVTSSLKETRPKAQKNSNLKLIDLSFEPKRVKEPIPCTSLKKCKVVLTDLTHKIDAAVARSSSGIEAGPAKKSRNIELIDLT